MDIEIKPIGRVRGSIKISGDKSISHRLVIIGSISQGMTSGANFLSGDDCMRTVDAFRQMGVSIKIKGDKIDIAGVGLKGLKKPDKELYLGNSGTSMRLLSGILAAQDFETVLTGDESLNSRPMARIINPLRMMGSEISSLYNNGCPPLKIIGKKLRSIIYKTPVASAQVKSCILLAGLYPKGETCITEPLKSRDHTERMLKAFGASVRNTKDTACVMPGSKLKGKKIIIPGDISSAVFFMVLAMTLVGSEVNLIGVGANPTRSRIIDIFKRMGANIKIKMDESRFEPVCDLSIFSSELKSTIVKEEEVPQIIDEIPALCVAAAHANGVTEIRGAGELRVKETDRILSICENLKALGVDITSRGDTIFVRGQRKRIATPKKISGLVTLKSYKDHRTAMAICVAAVSSDAACRIKDIECINTSFPRFFDMLNKLKQ